MFYPFFQVFTATYMHKKFLKFCLKLLVQSDFCNMYFPPNSSIYFHAYLSKFNAKYTLGNITL